MNNNAKTLVRYSPLGLGLLYAVKKAHFEFTKDDKFQGKMQLVFPHYNLGGEEKDMSVSIVSENQLEHVIKLCNTYKKSVRSVNDHAISAYKGINIFLDFSTFNQIKKINQFDQKCKTEPGITIAELNSQLKTYNFYVPYVIPNLNEKEESIQLDQAVQENRLCLQSLKYGLFKDKALERVSFVSGEGRMVQTGGYKVKDTYQFGFNQSDLLSGSNYTIGLLFEVVVNCFKHKHNNSGQMYQLTLNNVTEVSQIVRNFKDYVESKDEKQQGLADAVLISNLNTNNQVVLSSFDFNLNSQEAIKELQTYLGRGLKSIRSQAVSKVQLDEAFVQRFQFSSDQNRGVDSEIVLSLSSGSAIRFLDEYNKIMEVFPFQMHLLKKYVIIKLCFEQCNEEHRLFLDKITSEVIRVGGTVKASRKTLTTISPFLDKRLLGNYNMKIHNGLKQLYDPRDVLNPSAFFYLREKQDKSSIQRYKDKNKQLIQNTFAPSTDLAPQYQQIRSPLQRRRVSQADKSILSEKGHPNKNSLALKYLLQTIKFPQNYDETQALEGHPTQFMKVLNYTLFVASKQVKNFLFQNNVSPETQYVNDYNFMKKVFHILVKLFGYKPSLTLEQFFKYGFAEQKIILCCDVINIVKKAAKDIRIERSLSRKRSETTRDLQVSSYTIINHKSGNTKTDFVYERDTVNKVAKVKPLDEDLMYESQRQRSQIKERLCSSGQKLRSVSYHRIERESLMDNNRKYQHVQSRYLLNTTQQPPQATTEKPEQSIRYQALRNSGKQSQVHYDVVSEQQRISQSAVQPAHSQQQQPSQNEQILLLLRQTVEGLNQKFEQLQTSIDKKIDHINYNYSELNKKLDSIATKPESTSAVGGYVATTAQTSHPDPQPYIPLRERGQQVIPSTQSHGQAESQENPLKVFTFSDDHYRGMQYRSDGFQAQNTNGLNQDLREDSSVLVENIRRNLDESKRFLDSGFKTIKSDAHFQSKFLGDFTEAPPLENRNFEDGADELNERA